MKYMGSKSRIAKYIVPQLQNIINENKIESFYDIFCGGCNIIDKIICDKKIASDNNKYLIALLNEVKTNEAENLPKEVSKDFYDKIREDYKQGGNTYSDWLIGAVGFLASYNGRFFDGGYAKPSYEKTKNGERYRDYYQESKRNLIKQLPLIKTIDTIAFKDYRELEVSDSLIYCDIPYKNTKQYNTSKNFNHKEFWDWVRKQSEKNFVVVSELEAPEDFICIWQKDTPRSINAKAKTKATEKIFVYSSGKYASKYCK